MKPPNTYSIYLSNEHAEILAEYRSKNDVTLGGILMAGVGSARTYARDKMLALTVDNIKKFGDDDFFLSCANQEIALIRGTRFWCSENWDSYRVLGVNKEYTNYRDIPELYAGTRRNCELVAAHLNKILREAEEG